MTYFQHPLRENPKRLLNSYHTGEGTANENLYGRSRPTSILGRVIHRHRSCRRWALEWFLNQRSISRRFWLQIFEETSCSPCNEMNYSVSDKMNSLACSLVFPDQTRKKLWWVLWHKDFPGEWPSNMFNCHTYKDNENKGRNIYFQNKKGENICIKVFRCGRHTAIKLSSARVL
jgi:hypothetical protein